MNAMLADGWVETDSQDVVTLDLDDGQTLVGNHALRVTVTGVPAGATEEDPYIATLVKTYTGLTPGQAYYLSASQYPVGGTDFNWTTPEDEWTELVGGPVTANTNGEVAFTFVFQAWGDFETPSVAYFDRFRIVTPGCLDENDETPDDEPPNTSSLLFSTSFEEGE